MATPTPIPWRPAALSTLLALLVLAAGGFEALTPSGWLPRPGVWLSLILLAALAGQHRPLGGGGLGLGALVLPFAVAALGVWPAAVVAATAVLAADLLRRWIARRLIPDLGEERRLLRTLEGALVAAAATLAVSLAWRGEERPDLFAVVLSGAAAYLVISAALHALYLRLWRPVSWRGTLPLLGPLAAEAGGWLLGALALAAAPPWRLPLLAGFALLAAEAGRNSVRRELSERRAGRLRRMHDAHRRILGEISGPGGIAQQILTECRNVLPVHFYRFIMPGMGGGDQIWSAGPEGKLGEGSPVPPPNPPALPGIHRRASWHRIVKELRVEGETLATVSLWCDPRQLEPGAEELFSSLVPQMASSVHRARLDREAKLDSLTGLPVRRVLEQRLQEVYRRCCEEGSSMAVVMCDLDRFKAINDAHGHAGGDAALVQVARTLEETRRERDICCRYGGEELTLLLEDTDGPAAFQVAERLRLAVEALELVHEGQAVPLRISCGVAAFPELHVKTGSELLLLADEALYTAKAEGRNRSMLHCGKGSFRDVRGWLIEPEGEQPHTRPPRIFD